MYNKNYHFYVLTISIQLLMIDLIGFPVQAAYTMLKCIVSVLLWSLFFVFQNKTRGAEPFSSVLNTTLWPPDNISILLCPSLEAIGKTLVLLLFTIMQTNT